MKNTGWISSESLLRSYLSDWFDCNGYVYYLEDDTRIRINECHIQMVETDADTKVARDVVFTDTDECIESYTEVTENTDKGIEKALANMKMATTFKTKNVKVVEPLRNWSEMAVEKITEQTITSGMVEIDIECVLKYIANDYELAFSAIAFIEKAREDWNFATSIIIMLLESLKGGLDKKAHIRIDKFIKDFSDIDGRARYEC